MKTRILYTKFWHDNYISGLSIKEKLLFIYLTTNDQVNICGIYELPDRYIKFDLGLRQFELDKIKQKFMEDGKFVFIDGWIKIINHDIYNKFVGEKNDKAKERELSLIPIKIRDFIYPIEGVSTNGDTLNNHNQYINKNINKKEGVVGGDKTIKKKYNDVVFLSDIEYKKLIEELGEPLTKEYIENLSLYIQSKGRKYKSHYATILTWNKKDIEEGRNRLDNTKSIKQMAKDDPFDWGKVEEVTDEERNY